MKYLLRFLIGTATFMMSLDCLHAQSGVLPVYSDPMVFLDSTGKVVGQLPKGYKILNRSDGKHYRGWVKGMAVNTAGDEGMIPAIHYDANDISLFDRTGKQVRKLGLHYNGVTPNSGGFHRVWKNPEESFMGPTYFFLDRYGDRVFSPDGYRSATSFHDGMAAVRKDWQWMYIDDLGREYPIADTAFHGIRAVSPFYEGLSKIMFGPGTKCEYSSCYDFVFVDKSGKVVLDTRVLLPGELIYEVSDMQDGFALVELGNKSYSSSRTIVYLHRSGRMIRLENVWRRNAFENGLAVVVTQKHTEKGIDNDRCYLIDTLGREIEFPVVDDMVPYEAFRLDDYIYYVMSWHRTVSKGVNKLYDARLREYVYQPPDMVMGVRGTLVSMHNTTNKRYYVVDYRSGKVVYDTDVDAMVMTDMAAAVPEAEQVRTYVCTKKEELGQLNHLPGLTDLTLRNMDVATLPVQLHLPALKKLKIDNLMQLQEFPAYLKNLEKIALRDCVSATNLMELLEGQTQLKELYLVNFNLTTQQKSTIRNMFPGAQIVIEGTAQGAYSELQMYIPGF